MKGGIGTLPHEAPFERYRLFPGQLKDRPGFACPSLSHPEVISFFLGSLAFRALFRRAPPLSRIDEPLAQLHYHLRDLRWLTTRFNPKKDAENSKKPRPW